MPKSPATRKLDAARLEEMMTARGVSRAQLARIVGDVDPSQPTRWLQQKEASVPSGDIVEAMCHHFGCTPGYLFGRTPEECADYLVRAVRRELGDKAARVLKEMTREAPSAASGHPLEPAGDQLADRLFHDMQRRDQVEHKQEKDVPSRRRNRRQRREPRG